MTAPAVDLALHLVTDARLCGTRGVPAVVRAAVSGGVTVVQLREKTMSDEQLVDLVLEVAEDLDSSPATLVINDRVEVFLRARDQGARVDGLHIGQGDHPVDAVRDRVGPQAVLGLTAHTPEQLAVAERLPLGTVDYLGVGVVRPTATKPDHPPAIGVDGFGVLARTTHLPCVAIGGIRPADVGPLRQVGARGVAVVSAVCAAADPAAAARDLKQEWDR